MGNELTHFIVETDLVGFATRHIIKEHFAFSVRSRALKELVPFRNKLPALARNENIVERVVSSMSGAHSLGPVFPKPAHRVRQDSGSLFTRMPAIAPSVLHFIACKRQRAFHSLISHPPVATVSIEIVGAVLHEYTNGLWLVFSNQARIAHTAPQINVCADRTKDTCECIWSFPRGGKGGDCAARRTADGAVVAVV